MSILERIKDYFKSISNNEEDTSVKKGLTDEQQNSIITKAQMDNVISKSVRDALLKSLKNIGPKDTDKGRGSFLEKYSTKVPNSKDGGSKNRSTVETEKTL